MWKNRSRPIFRIRFPLLDRRDTVLWVEMDCRQKEWSNEVSKEQYLSYDQLLPAATAEVSAVHGG